MTIRLLSYLLLLGIVFQFNDTARAKNIFNIEVQIQDSVTVKNLLRSSDTLYNQGDFEAALAKIDSASALARSIGYTRGIVLSRTSTLDILLVRKQADSALALIDRTLREYPENPERLRLYSSRATALNMKGMSDEAILSYQKALEFIGDLPAQIQDRSRAATLVNMASAYENLGNKAKALENYLLGLEFAESSKDTSFLLIVLNNLGDTYNTHSEYEKSEYYLERALSIAEEKNFRPDLLRISLNLANVYSNLGKTEEALTYYQKALVLNKELRPDTPPFQIVYNLGELYLDLGDFENARSSFNESLQYCLDLNIPIGLYYNYSGLGKVSEALSEYDNALEWYQKALDVAESLGQTPFISQLNERFYVLNKELGRPDEALNALEKFKTISDSLNALDVENALSNLESNLEVKRQTEINRLLEEKQIQQEEELALRKSLIVAAIIVIILLATLYYFNIQINRERKRANAALRKQKEELEELDANKNKFFAVVAHDLRSPLASMQGILELIKDSNLSIEEIKTLSRELEPALQKNIDTMNDLLVWSKSQMSGITLNKELIQCHEIVEDLISKHEFQIDVKKIKVQNNIPVQTGVTADNNAIRLVLRNLLVNAIKFTNLNGNIVFDAYKDNNSTYITVKDNGIGIPVNLQSKMFTNQSGSRTGTNQEEGSGFGLRLSKEFALRMNGDLTFESIENEGTTFYLKLPAP